MEEVKKKKEVVKRGDDEPDWQNVSFFNTIKVSSKPQALMEKSIFQNLSSWKDKRRKQSEEALQRVTEVKALESDGEDFNQRQKL